MQTRKLRELPKDEEEIALIQLGAGLMEYNSLPYLKRRREIDLEIRERQETWRSKPEEQATGQPGASNDIGIPAESEEPPSIHS